MTSEMDVNAEARVSRTVSVRQHAGRPCAHPSVFRDTCWELTSDVVPDRVRPAFKHASPAHDVEIVTGGVRVWLEECWPVDGEEVDVGVLARPESRLQVALCEIKRTI